MSSNHDGAVPEQCNEGECQRSRDDWDMDQARSGRVTEVEPGEVNEIGNDDKFGGPEVIADEAHDETKPEEVVQNEVGADIACCSAPVLVSGVEMPDVGSLEDEKDEPRSSSVDEARLLMRF
jgi:hypothetical protein